MKKLLAAISVVIAFGVSTFTAFAADEGPFDGQIEARQAFMNVYKFNLGLLGAMAKGDAPYDAKLASASAHNLLAAANMKNSAMWPVGSDAGAPGLEAATAAKPGLWSADSEAGEKHQSLLTALTEMAAVAGDGLGSVQANMGAVGKGCKGCHESYRVSED